MNFLDIILIAIVAALVAGAVLILRSNKKKGRACPGCSESCASCDCCKRSE